MKKIVALAVVLSGVLGGCALIAPYEGPDPTQPRITFELNKPDFASNPQFNVAPRELLFKKRGEKTITWSLDPGSKLSFAAKDGISIDGEIKNRVLVVAPNAAAPSRERVLGASDEYVDKAQDEIGGCQVSKDGLTATCVNKHSRAGRYKYSVRLTNGTTDFLLDPVINNW